ncbi:MAG: UDP-N-acetylmuramoyl-tripeptide--D-alanyl-D-alanine ligase [Candidatus Eisenbacteria bacterium]|nr:UDP-N-acetylmuramoyl-tripeptide--D-alanyl-D-alanine ligase [Candidatus Eisenbacteria bacterium]
MSDSDADARSPQASRGPDVPPATDQDPWSLGAIAAMTQATVAGISPQDWSLVAPLVVSGVALDSRSVRGGEIFLALRGERVDGHAYIAPAFDAGAAAAIARRGWWSRRRAARARGVHLLVDDPAEALQQWAAALRARLRPRVVAITGSSGKTGTKEMLLALLAPLGGVIGTQGNRNNLIGLPWTLLQLRPEHRWAVLEMGANHRGEIARLSQIAQPDVAVLTCVGRAHEGEFGGRAALRAAKLEILEGLARDGAVVIPDDDAELAAAVAERWSGRLLRFGRSAAADVRLLDTRHAAEGTELQIDGLPQPLALRQLGQGAVTGALAALAAARALDLREIDPSPLSNLPPLAGRLDPRRHRGVLWLLDMYNASPESTMANLQLLEQLPAEGRRVFVFGGMRELGEESEALHVEVGRAAGFCDAGVFVGPEARRSAPVAQKAGERQVIWCDEPKDAVRFLRSYLRRGDIVLLKGARAAALEAIAEALGVIDAQYGTWGG